MKSWAKWIILFALFLMAIINFADKSILGLAGIHITQDLNLTSTEFGILGSSFYWLFSIFGIVGGSFSDRIGTGKSLAIMAIVWTIAQSMALFASSLPVLILSRVLLGAGEGAYMATAISHISKMFKPESRGFAISIISFGNVVGIAVTAPIIVSLISIYGWRNAFFISGIFSFLWFICWIWLGRMKPTISEQYEVSTIENKTKNNRKEVWEALRSPKFIFTTLIAFIAYSFIVFGLTFNPSYLIKVKGLSEQQSALVIAVSGLIGAISAIGLSIISDRLYKKAQNIWKSRILFSTISVLIAGMLYSLYPLMNGVVTIIILLSLVNTMVATVNTLSPAIVVSILPHRRGVMTGTYFGIMTSSGIITPIIFGKLIQNTGVNAAGGYSIAVFGISITMVIAAFLTFLFGNRKQQDSIEKGNKLVNL
ncbi:MFS transporter [Gottfriedia acidiceleris]|uniref:MFS transporter n=1 Tax=Gottfriedia acidiceleris TaxID=371036 RepID=A0ABY4JHU2_9BACI|nr:MFS transporter [Gottfriedia acidiceleris]UPM53396.1 MFS transporter [Gottfriedia acidiceleris]